jgi:hypothetical protein
MIIIIIIIIHLLGRPPEEGGWAWSPIEPATHSDPCENTPTGGYSIRNNSLLHDLTRIAVSYVLPSRFTPEALILPPEALPESRIRFDEMSTYLGSLFMRKRKT